MRILAIHLKNLASLEGENYIDFQTPPLSTAGIFAITGPTGAGKSTILDALCLALYARTPRYGFTETGLTVTDAAGNKIAQNDARGILRDGAGEGFAKVDFESVDGNNYRATWLTRRSRGKADGKLQKYEMELLNLSGSQPVPGKKSELLQEIERLVGLSFEQFTRSVLLAQGDFSAFLKSREGDKSSLLEKLTGTQIYSDISKRIYENTKAQERVLSDKNLLLKNIQLLSEEEEENERKKLGELRKQSAETDQLIQQINKAIDWKNKITDLTKYLKLAESDYEESLRKLSGADERQRQLAKIKSVQPARELVKLFLDSKKSEGDKQTATEQISKQFAVLNQRKLELEREIFDLAEAVDMRETACEAASSDLKLAAALDVKVAEQSDQLKEIVIQTEGCSAALALLEKGLEGEGTQLEELKSERTRLQNWQQDHKERVQVAEQEKLIIEKLRDAAACLNQQNAAEKELEQIYQQRKNLDSQVQVFFDEKLSSENKFKQENDSYQNSLSQIGAIDFPQLKSQIEITENKVLNLNAAKSQWKQLCLVQTELKKASEELDRLIVLKRSKDNALAEVSQLLPIMKAAKEAANEMLQKAQLTVTDKVETLRNNLEDDEPCPVCGSTVHPFKSVDNKLHQVFAELKTAYQLKEEAFIQQQKQEAALQQELQHLADRKQEIQAAINAAENSVIRESEAWLAISATDIIGNIPQKEQEDYLEQIAKEESKKLAGLHLNVEVYQNLKDKCDEQRQLLNKIEKEITQKDNLLKDAERELRTISERETQIKNNKDGLADSILAVKTLLNGYFTSENWFAQWKKTPEQFLEKVASFSAQWNNSLSREEALTQRLIEAEFSFKSSGEKVYRQQELLKDKNLERERKERTVNDLKEKRSTYFAGKPVAEVERELQNLLKSAQEKLSAKQREKDQNLQEFASCQALKSRLESELQSASREFRKNTEKLDEWIKVFNHGEEQPLTLDTLTQLLAFDLDWQEREQQLLQTLRDDVLQNKSIKEERAITLQSAIEAHLTEKELDQLFEDLKDLKQKFNDLTNQIQQIAGKLTQQTADKARSAALLLAVKQQTVVFDSWAKLNDLIGSADGKKFRQIAQQYTLDALLTYANAHLQTLSQRYLLQRIPESLGLQVIDLDMGETVRTVFSLSGGETFLVSLALALGLASLSSHKMKVESLFIDEGFGALDSDTLQVAMDALERLQSMGRKVGVISHVQEMTERIPVQIKVSKHQNGRSKLEIIAV